jgi:CHAT domain-containing protein
LNDARQVYQALSFSSRNQSGPSVASDPSSNSSFIRSNLSDIAFNPAFLNVSFTKNSDLGVGDSNNGFIDLSLITSEGTVIGRRTELPLSELSSLLRGFYGKITSQRSLDPALQTSEASRLYALFIEPLQDVLTSEAISTVLISADRGLQAIPFSALAHQGQYAVENISFSFTPSLSLTDLSIPLENPEIDQILIMGSTEFSGLAPLPFVNQEVANIGQYYGAQSVLGEQFTSTRAVSDLRSSDQSLIHLATHADFKGGSPDESVIHTSDGSISFESFKSIRRERQSNPINLFVLSACRSALGDSDSEMGFAGMALQAGSKSAIGSLWYVDDVATSAFFSQFYRYLSRGVTKSTALTQTQRDFALGNIKIQGTDVVFGSDDVLLSGLSASQRYNYPSDFRHPFFWSGFVLLGTPW